jgi:peptide/nickel transport system substrate-binding protein/oligopeptide transport system substrate-binding protein
MLLSACAQSAGYRGFATNVPTPAANGTPQAPYDQQIFRYPLALAGQDITTFDPALVIDDVSNQAISMVFVGLVTVDDNLQVQPELAQSWNQSPDGLQWTFHLRPHLTFSDGTPLTSADVAYSIDRALQPATKSTTSPSYLQLIKDADKLHASQIKTIIGDSVVTPDASTVMITTNKKAAYFLYTLTYATSFVVEKRLIDKYGANFTDHLTEGGGAGPFVVSRYVHKQEIDFVPNPYYYGLKPLLQKVVFPFFPRSLDITYREYQQGNLDFTLIPPDRLHEAMQLTNDYHQNPVLLIRYLAMNFLAKPFDNLHIRQAFALSINRETLNNDIFQGVDIPTYHLIPQGMVGYNLNLVGPANIKDSRGNVLVARQLLQLGLQEQGWSAVSAMPPITLIYPKSPVYDKVITVVSQMWKDVLGVTITPVAVDLSSLETSLEHTRDNPRGAQLWFSGWGADYPDPEDWTTLQFGNGADNNSMNYGQNTTADALQEQAVQQQLQQADAEANLATRLLLYQNAEQQLINQVAWIPLYQETNTALLKPYVQGYVVNPLRLVPPNDWANIYIAVH